MTAEHVERILLTGFEPFDGQPVNASWLAVQHAAQVWAGQQKISVEQLPVSFRGARQALRTAIARDQPDVVICVGEAGGRTAVGLERVAVNLIDARIPDNDGSAPVDLPVVAGAPAAFLSTLPLKACLQAVRAIGVPVEVSLTAGSFVCNATFYALMHLLATMPGARGGLVHVPRTPEQLGGDAATGSAGLPTADVALALDAVMRATCANAEDLRLPAGRED